MTDTDVVSDATVCGTDRSFELGGESVDQPSHVANFTTIDFNTMWTTLGYDHMVKSDMLAAESDERKETTETLPIFASKVGQLLPAWSDLFKEVPSGNKWRKDALGGAIKIKNASKSLAEVSTEHADLQKSIGDSEASGVEEGAGSAQVVSTDGTHKATDQATQVLSKCQAAFRDAVLGLLEVSFPVDEGITAQDFADADATAAAMDR